MRAFTIRMSDVERCPIRSLSPRHYREDGSCRCVRCAICSAGPLSEGREMREHVAAEHPERFPSYLDVETGEVRP